jgi:uncharacterized protein YdaU (DUF1376 family)
MSFSYMALFTGDYLRDTRHLTPMRHGIYLLLLMHCWDQKGPLPLEQQECAGIANCRSHDEIDGLIYILNKYFVKMDDGWYNRRIQAEIERAESISHARSEAGRRGYQAKAKQLPNKSKASVSTPTPTPISIPTPTTTSHLDKASRGSRLSVDWKLPKAWGEWALAEFTQLSAGKIRSISAVFRDYWIAQPGQKGVKVDWEATWRNWVRKEIAPDGAPDEEGKTERLMEQLRKEGYQ